MAKKSKKELDLEEPEIEDAAFSESYLSMGLGLLVVLVVGVLLFNFLNRGNNESDVDSEDNQEASEEQENEAPTAEEEGAYTVVEGDTLWSIAEETYESGFEWQRIADENGLANPHALEAGQTLTLPTVQANVLPETGISADKATIVDTYTVVDGDTLWSISCQVYGDCYRWLDIFEANSLASADYIDTGIELSIPR